MVNGGAEEKTGQGKGSRKTMRAWVPSSASIVTREPKKWNEFHSQQASRREQSIPRKKGEVTTRSWGRRRMPNSLLLGPRLLGPLLCRSRLVSIPSPYRSRLVSIPSPYRSQNRYCSPSCTLLPQLIFIRICVLLFLVSIPSSYRPRTVSIPFPYRSHPLACVSDFAPAPSLSSQPKARRNLAFSSFFSRLDFFFKKCLCWAISLWVFPRLPFAESSKLFLGECSSSPSSY